MKQQVVQLLVGPSIKIDHVKFNGGFSLEYRTSPSFRSATDSPINLTSSIGEPTTQFNFMVGTEFYLGPRSSTYLTGIIPAQSANSSSFQVGLKYRLHARYEKIQSHRQHVKEMAKKDIVLLKEGALLVRLKTSENTIAALRKAEREKQALKEDEWQATQNQKIVKAFWTYFDFAPVYFFYSDKSNQVRKGDFEGIFLNEKLEVDSSIILDKQTF